MSKNTFQLNIAIHPGESLEELLETINMSQIELAERTGLTNKTINEIVQGKNSITSETAIKLASVFGMSAEYWNNKERRYQETLSHLQMQEELEKEKGFLKKFTCYKKLQELGFVENTKEPKEKVRNLLSFFGVSSLEFIHKTQAVAFRKMPKENTDNIALAAWLRAGEVKGAEIKTEPFDKKKLLASIPKLRALSRKKPEVYSEEIRGLLASCGIAVVYMPYFEKTYVHGATRWISSEKALIQLSLLYKWEDMFWFSLFHEIGHIVKHGKKEEFLEFKNADNKFEKKEEEADEFAQKTLIADKDLRDLQNISPTSIKSLAQKIDIAPSIVAGRVAHELSVKGNNHGWKAFANMRPRLELTGNGS
ncbi:MAG: HigA family addiction module antidote protein [Candidatus Aenigmarchaeota archaeon]|nr:HigA family addiction module antidote protein [Candidatus Aenigmarchaeota archaeon]